MDGRSGYSEQVQSGFPGLLDQDAEPRSFSVDVYRLPLLLLLTPIETSSRRYFTMTASLLVSVHRAPRLYESRNREMRKWNLWENSPEPSLVKYHGTNSIRADVWGQNEAPWSRTKPYSSAHSHLCVCKQRMKTPAVSVMRHMNRQKTMTTVTRRNDITFQSTSSHRIQEVVHYQSLFGAFKRGRLFRSQN